MRGSPEAMGDIMARHGRLADEYSSILVSYLNPDGNFLEHEGLQAGVLWAVGRLGRARPELVLAARAHLHAFLNSPVANIRAFALWGAVPIADETIRSLARACLHDDTIITLYEDGRLQPVKASALAGAILAKTG